MKKKGIIFVLAATILGIAIVAMLLLVKQQKINAEKAKLKAERELIEVRKQRKEAQKKRADQDSLKLKGDVKNYE